ncbi:hypothetical protein HMPREF1989_01762 [Porphyromonas gingivalis F0566]|nr:hypothetical protein HMPREF1989_01762 [Porphyromonas gingivalis F0566]
MFRKLFLPSFSSTAGTKKQQMGVFPSPTFLRLKKCSRVGHKNVAREIFHFGARSEKFTSQNEKI